MPRASSPPGFDPAALLVIVVGAHPRAEWGDRPAAYLLRDAMTAWLSARFGPADRGLHPCVPLVVTDVWTLNDPALNGRPCVAVGGPSLNAVTAGLVSRLPAVAGEQGLWTIAVEADGAPAAAVWGADERQTARAVEVFARRFLAAFMQDATAVWGPD